MKKIYFVLISLLAVLSSASFAQKAPSYDWPSCRNSLGSASPEQPSVIYLGEQGVFGCDSWGQVNGNDGKWQVVIKTANDISNSGTSGTWTGLSNTEHKTALSPRFTSIGTWYWGIKVEYTNAGTTTGWYCINNASWAAMYGTPASNLTVTVSALENPTTPAATPNPISQINLSWTKWNSKNVMVVRRLTSAVASTAPTQGTAYTVGTTLGTGTVVYTGGETSFSDTGLTPGTSYTYTFYSENYSYYSAGATAEATTATQTSAATDYFRSKATTGNWSVAGTWESSPDNTNWITSTLVPGATASAITILNSHAVTLDANVTIPFLTINSAGTFTASDASPRSLTISKSASGSSTTLSNSGTWVNGTGGSTVIFTGAPSSGDAIQAISGTIPFQNITVNKTGGSSNVGVSFGSSSTVSGTVEIGSGGFVSTAPPTGFYGTNAILKFNQGSGATYDVTAGDYSWSTTVIPNFITISSGTVNLNAARTATGNLLIDGGTLSLAAGLIIQGNWTRSSGTFTPNSQLVTLAGATNTLIDAAGGATLYDLVVSKTGGAYVSLNSNLTVSNNLSVSDGAILTIPSAKALTVAGTITNSAGNTGLLVKSGGSLIQNSAVAATVERNISAWVDAAHGWHYLSSPVTAQSISSAFTDATATNYDFYTWWEPTNVWVNYKNTTISPVWSTANVLGATSGAGNFIPGKGYLVAYAASSTRQFAGTLNKDNIVISNLAISSGTNKSWHLLGNPFASAITWGTGWSLTNINTTSKIWKESTASWADISSGGIIPALNGFMVEVTATYGGNNSLTIPTGARLHDATVWYKSASEQSIVLNANDPTGQTAQESKIRIVPESTGNFDSEFDSHFLAGYAPKFYSTIGAEQLSTNTLPDLPSESVIPFGFEKNNATNFSIELKQSIIGLPVYLTDLKTNTDQNLTENPVYTFTSEAGDDPNRFLLHFLNTTGTVKPTAAQIKVYSVPGKINISGVDGKAEILVRNMMGQIVLRNSVSGSTLNTVNTANLPVGVYVVSVVSASKTVSQKVVVSE